MTRKGEGSDPLAEQRPKRHLRLLATLLAVDAVILFATLSYSSPAVYSLGVDDILANSARWSKRSEVRVTGVLVHGSLYRLRSACEHRFRLRSWQGGELEVRYAREPSELGCLLPDTLCDWKEFDLEVVAQGRLTRGERGVYLAAAELLTKCPGKYYPPSQTALRLPCSSPVLAEDERANTVR